MKIGITGGDGFIGSNLNLCLKMRGFSVSCCPKDVWLDECTLADWCGGCDAIVHLAGMSRSENGPLLYEVNMELTKQLIQALEVSQSRAHLYFGSTTHEQRKLPYHKSKRDSRKLLEEFAAKRETSCTTLLMANTFGPFAKPFFNSVVSTFCALAARHEKPQFVDENAILELIYIRDLVQEIADCVQADVPGITEKVIPARYKLKLTELVTILEAWNQLPSNEIPVLGTPFEADLWATYTAYR